MKGKLMNGLLLLGLAGVISFGCESNLEGDVNVEIDSPLMEVAELTSQLSSGMDLTFAKRKGGKPEGANFGDRPEGVGRGRPDGVGGGRPGGTFTAGIIFQKYNDDPNLQVISIAERLGERMNFWLFSALGAKVTQIDENGESVEIEISNRSENRFGFRKRDESTPKIAQTIIDFGEGISIERGQVSLSMSGNLTINRSFSDNQLTETISFENLVINGASVTGTKTSVRTFDKETGEGEVSSTVSGGKFTFSDGTTVDWVSSKSRNISIEINEDGRPTSGSSTSEGETSIISSDGTVLYSYKTTNPIQTDLSCTVGRGRKPVSGSVETTYGDNTVVVDFGSGECVNSISVTINGTTVNRSIDG